jgi:hypothetical protein
MLKATRAASAAQSPPLLPDLDRVRRFELEHRIERARQRLLAATTWPERAERWEYMRRLIFRRTSFEREASGPEPSRAIVKRVLWELLFACEIRSTRQ